jgi:dinuclear metal center YbgI/SA1388 family protein
MKLAEIIAHLETIAPPSLQESYDNAGLITGDPEMECTGLICSLDTTVEVIEEAIQKKANVIVSHHPIVFSGLKKITGKNYVEKALIRAIKNDIAIYAIHTNLDNVLHGVNGRIADLLGLQTREILSQKANTLKKLYFFVPVDHAAKVRNAIFDAGAGQVGNYSECSFNTSGQGTFKAEPGANPFVGRIGETHVENELRIEAVFPPHLQGKIVAAMKAAHPYEEVAFDVVDLANTDHRIGSGLLGDLPEAIAASDFLQQLKQQFGLSLVRHTAFHGRPIKKVAICGGAGSFLINKALAAGADAFVTGDLKYHEFFDANGRLLLCDIGHYESEQFTIDLLWEVLAQKFPTFAVLKTGVRTNPVYYF